MKKHLPKAKHTGQVLFSRAATAFLLVLVLVPAATGAARIGVQLPVWDFGSVTNLTEISHDYVVQNLGDSDIQIESVISSCSACLSASASETIIPPGGVSLVHSRLDLRRLSGQVVRTLAIHSNDPEVPVFTLGVTGVVIPIYLVTPSEIDLDFAAGRREAKVEIAPLTKLRAPLSQAVCDDPDIRTSLSRVASNRFMVTVRALDSFPRGRVAISIRVQTADSNDPPCLVTGTVRNPPDLEVIPSALQFRPVAEPQTLILWLRQRGAAPMSLIDVVGPSDRFRCEVENLPPGPNYRIYVTARRQEGSIGKTSALILKMRDRQQRLQTISVPIFVGTGSYRDAHDDGRALEAVGTRAAKDPIKETNGSEQKPPTRKP